MKKQELKQKNSVFAKSARPPPIPRPASNVSEKVYNPDRAVEFLDNIGSSVANLNSSSKSASRTPLRSNRISVLAFEVANTITKGANLFKSLSQENVELLKKEILPSEGVQKLVSTDMNQLLIIAAADKREQFDVFLKEVIRFGNLCVDPQWHNLDRFFSKLDREYSSHKLHRVEAELNMNKLTTLALYTYELYHGLHTLDRFESDYRVKLEEVESLHRPHKGSLRILQSEVKAQRKIVRSFKKKSLWSKTFEEIMEELVDFAYDLNQETLEAHGNNGVTLFSKEPSRNPQTLGAAGLALHYANIINLIDNIASSPTSLPPKTRDTLYRGLPTHVKTVLRSRLQKSYIPEEYLNEMENTLRWLVPLATNTTKVHQRFGCIGEWASNGYYFGKNTATNSGNLNRLQTLYHADKEKTELCILELVTQLHVLMNLVRDGDHHLKALPFCSKSHSGPFTHSEMKQNLSQNDDAQTDRIQLSQEDRDLLENMSGRGLVSRLSRSLKLVTAKKRGKVCELSRSAREFGSRQNLTNQNTINILDVMDGLDFTA